MPARNTIRRFNPDETYHIYNRGNNREVICIDQQDYATLLKHILRYTLPTQEVKARWPSINPLILQKNLSNDVELACYCLMPNHYHLLLRQRTINGISRLMKQTSNSYTRYMNFKYYRQGSLFQGVYKAVKIQTEESLLQASRYIHLNPFAAGLSKTPFDYRWSSIHDYLSDNPKDCKVDIILNSFKDRQGYRDFIGQIQPHEVSPKTLALGETWENPSSPF